MASAAQRAPLTQDLHWGTPLVRARAGEDGTRVPASSPRGMCGKNVFFFSLLFFFFLLLIQHSDLKHASRQAMQRVTC